FATEPAEVATLDVPTASVSASHSIVAIETITGTVDLLDREKLGQKVIVEPAGVSVGADVAAAVPYGSRVVTVAPSGRMQVVDDSGAKDLPGKCPAPSWSLPTRRAVVFGCGTGAVRVTGGAGDLAVTAMPYPAGAPEQRPDRMQHRDRAD
ncbi:ABC transporter, partial [Mycobacterium sp. ITM-2017-0098]